MDIYYNLTQSINTLIVVSEVCQIIRISKPHAFKFKKLNKSLVLLLNGIPLIADHFSVVVY